jgi:DNA-binding NarL/FixJ family response regulator
VGCEAATRAPDPGAPRGHPLFRAGARQRPCEHDPDLEIVGEADSSLQAREMVVRLAPDVVLVDIATPGENGIDATRASKAWRRRRRSSSRACTTTCNASRTR